MTTIAASSTTTPPAVPDEAARLAALRALGVLDTEPEPAFDELVLLASRICEVPISLVSLIDEDRQWFKARVGLGPTETPREDAFCAWTITGDGTFVVPDAAADPRFADNPLVTGDPDIRFYAGTPLRAEGGEALGSLCVIDSRPRQLTPEQLEALEIIGRQVSRLLQSRRQRVELLDDASQGLAVVERGRGRLRARIVYANDAFWPLTGVDATGGDGRADLAAVLRALDPAAAAGLRAAVVGGMRWSGSGRISDTAGSTRHVELTSHPAGAGRDGGRSVLVVMDVTVSFLAAQAVADRERLLTAVLDTTDDLIVSLDVSGRYTTTNAAFRRLAGEVAPGLDLIGATAAEVFGGRGAEPSSHSAIAIAAREPRRFEETVETPSGPRRFETVRSPLLEDGEPYGLVVVATDVTEATRLRGELSARAARATALTELRQITSQGGSLPAILAQAAEIARDTLGGQAASVMAVVPGEDRLEPVAHAGAVDGPTGPVDALSRRARDRGVALASDQTVAAPIPGVEGPWAVLAVTAPEREAFDDHARDFLGTVAWLLGEAVTRDRAERDRHHRDLHDELTGLPNRVQFELSLATTLADRERPAGTRPLIVIVDVDGFARLNATLGRAAADRVLVDIGHRLREACGRSGGAVDELVVARFDGDAFAVLYPAVPPAAARRTVERMVATLARPHVLAGRDRVITASAGAVLADRDDDVGEVERHAQLALAVAQREGPSGAAVFDDAMRAQAARLDVVTADLPAAIANGELDLHYQPVTTVATGDVHAVEALVRWNHPVLGRVSPAELLPAAEALGLMVNLGRFVIRRACAEAATWPQSAASAPSVFVNLSAPDLADGWLADTVRSALHRAGLPPQRLGLEITEGALVADNDDVQRNLASLRQLGVRFVLDDFGTGYSALTWLKRFPISTVKIDKGFVAGLGTETQDEAIVAAVITLSHTLGLDVVGEGVETAEQQRWLTELGCDHLQGFLLARPLTADALAAYLARRPA